MHRILIVEDEDSIREGLLDLLTIDGYDTAAVADGEAALEKARAWRPHLVLLDLMLPKSSGFEVCRHLRKHHPDIFVIMLTAKNEEMSKIAGLEMGADDYVTKPFSPRELAARVRAVLRRVRGPDEARAGELRAGGLTLCMDELRAELNGRPLSLSCQELRLLECLMRHPARIYTRDVLINAIYDGQAVVSDRTIDAQVKRLRQKISALDPAADPVQTVYGMGYKFRDGRADQ